MKLICSKCKIEKSCNDFYKNKAGPTGYYTRCKPCANETKRRWSKNNRNRILNKQKQYYLDNKEKIQKRHRKWFKDNRKKFNQYVRELYNTDINYRLSEILRKRLRMALKLNSKIGSAVKDLGCSIEEFKKYIESKFQPGMSWDNYGMYSWHIDHIIPLSKFKLTDRDEFLKACHYTNLQPLWAKDNWSKNNRI